MGKRDSGNFTERLVSSESVVCQSLGFEMERDVDPGEAVIVRMDGRIISKVCHPKITHTPCVFEHVYFARPDSVIDGISVHKARLRMGESLAKRISNSFQGAELTLPWLDEQANLRKEKNFFETRVTEYQTGGALSWD